MCSLSCLSPTVLFTSVVLTVTKRVNHLLFSVISGIFSLLLQHIIQLISTEGESFSQLLLLSIKYQLESTFQQESKVIILTVHEIVSRSAPSLDIRSHLHRCSLILFSWIPPVLCPSPCMLLIFGLWPVPTFAIYQLNALLKSALSVVN